ncbi:MAG: OmpH family outer membrane protein [Spirochaetaceae bacterium]|nr:OmpH family outer membrane protein [Spirochaetaceae bacterium]
MKKFICLFAVSLLVCTAFAQEITKVAVIDLQRINDSFRTESQASRDYEQKKQKYQAEIKSLQDEVLKLKNEKLDAEKKNKDSKTIQKYEALITSKTNFLTEYVATKNAELKSLLNKLLTSDAFYSAVYNAVKAVAETEGYTVVLNLQDQNSSIIWYSQTINITDLVIERLK